MSTRKVVALFVEGPTEIEFYKAVVKYAHDVMAVSFDCEFEWIDMHGIGNYKNDTLRKFKTVQKKHPDKEIYALLCIDTDVFEFAKKPPIDKSAIKKAVEGAGAKKVLYIEAKHSIEDWFLADFEGVLSYLRLPKCTKRPKGKGQDALKKLFRDAKKVYIKGSNTENFINVLDIGVIMRKYCDALKILCTLVGFDCKKVCNKV
ncbi:MAG: hypothetical protein IKU51_01730 [Clostridia bacterium]|nr:hypothetical protein [Clostridia bacterium]